MNNNRLWTERAAKILEELWMNSKVSNYDIESVFNTRSWGAICKKAERMKLPNRSEITDAIDWDYYNKLQKEVIEG